jgi:hypothetical protein
MEKIKIEIAKNQFIIMNAKIISYHSAEGTDGKIYVASRISRKKEIIFIPLSNSLGKPSIKIK